MNAGGMGGKAPMAVTADGATYMFAQNVLGHVVLLEALLTENRLGEVAVFAGSEAAGGFQKWGSSGRRSPQTPPTSSRRSSTAPTSPTTSPTSNWPIGQAKFIGALWMAFLARQYPDRRLITVSPGNTTGTQAPNDLALPLRLAAKYVMPYLGVSHELDVGAKRLVDGVTDPKLSSGVFYASAAGKMTGPMVDQTDVFPDLADASFQDHANEAIHRFMG